MQTLIVVLLVCGCSAYAVWALMPSAARRSLAAAMLRVPHLPRAVEMRLRRSAKAAPGCGCDGCDQAPAKTTAPQPITIHRRAR